MSCIKKRCVCLHATGFLANVGKCHAVLEGLCEQHAVNIINLRQTAVRVCLRNVFSLASAQILDVRNVLVVVSRWYGGILLGPDRFKHISNCARSILIQEAYTDTSVRIRTNMLFSQDCLSIIHFKGLCILSCLTHFCISSADMMLIFIE